jgi:hypothetical protein
MGDSRQAVQAGRAPGGAPHRRVPRVRCRAEVRISEPGSSRTTDATCVDLSAGGIGVNTGAARPVGSRVLCRLHIEGQTLDLPGVVAWARGRGSAASARGERHDTKTLVRLGSDDAAAIEAQAGEPAVAESAERDASMGIAFEALAEAQAQALAALIRASDPLTSTVELKFAGLDTRVKARAEASAEGLRLRAALPFLELDSKLTVSFAGDGQTREGRIARVELDGTNEQRVPQLIVHVALVPEAEAADASASPTSAPEREQGAPNALDEAAVARFAQTVALVALLASAGVPAAWLLTARSAQGVAMHAAKLAPASPSRPIATEHAPQAPEPAAAAATVAQPASGPMVPAFPPAAAPATPSAPSAPLPVAAPAAAVPPPTAPQVTIVGAQTRVFVPMDGSAEGLHAYHLSSPGAVLSLPQAHARIRLADYPIYQGVVRRVWLRPYQSGVQVRVVWRNAAVRYELEFTDSGLTIVAH